jgi:TonB family protein
MKLALFLLLAPVTAVGLLAGTPALFQSGSIPVLSIMSTELGGGEVLLEVTVDRTGTVTGMKALRETATFTERMTGSVKTWRFAPAEADIAPALRKPGGPATEAVETKLLVAGVFRRPALIGATLGEPIKDVAAASNDIPFPSSLITPKHPPRAVGSGVVLVEVHVDAKGSVTDAKVRMSSPAFDSAALDAARLWKFRAAKPAGVSTPAVVYIVFGFPVLKS